MKKALILLLASPLFAMPSAKVLECETPKDAQPQYHVTVQRSGGETVDYTIFARKSGTEPQVLCEETTAEITETSVKLQSASSKLIAVSCCGCRKYSGTLTTPWDEDVGVNCHAVE